MFDKFKRDKAKQPADMDDPMLIVPVPTLVATLARLESEKGEPLTEDEVNHARDNCPCIAMPTSVARQVAEKRGYDDIDPDSAWEQWVVAREQLKELDGEG